MAEFLVKRTGPAAVRVLVPSETGDAAVTFRVREGATRRVTIPTRHVDYIDPAHATHLVRLAALEDNDDAADAKTMPATPNALKITIEG